MGVIRRIVIFWDLALYSVAKVRLSPTRLPGIASQRTGSLRRTTRVGRSNTLVSNLRMHMYVCCSHVLDMYYDSSASRHTMKNFSTNDFTSQSKSKSENGRFKRPFINGSYLKGESWNNGRFSCYPYCQLFSQSTGLGNT
jgi:hypothetical protein